MRTRSAFTLVELLVVIGIITLLISILLPVVSRAREAANTTKCLSNLRQLQIAQTNYAAENRNELVQAGMAEGGASGDEEAGWFVVLQKYTSSKLLSRCPSDESAYWDSQTVGVVELVNGSPQMVQKHRQSSYGINTFLDRNLCPWGPNQDPNLVPPGGLYTKISKVRRTSDVVQFVEMARAGTFAVSDHLHIENWDASPAWNPLQTAGLASNALALNAHGGKVGPESRANYSFLDGHAATLRFSEVFKDFKTNKFDPAVGH
jgi:prepilin-type N-terminal cleavage/methylation domain-containing protein/prepilin-type processing-associated H-X9-DG protein